jgi:rod shape-determining protein MreC
MQNLFLFLKKTFPVLLFLFLEGIAVFLTVQHNKYHKASWNNSSASFYSYVFGIKQNINDYFGLKKVNLELALENENLKNKLSSSNFVEIDSTAIFDTSELKSILPYYKPSDGFQYILTRVVGNSSNQKYNYITLDKGKKDGIYKGMGVVDRYGVIGMTIASSENNTLVISLLNIKASLSVRHKLSGGVGMLRWEGRSEDVFAVNHVNKNFDIKEGDTVVTSGYSSFFPPEYPVGSVVKTYVEQSGSFQKLDIKTFNRVGDADFVYVIFNKNKSEIDSLMQIVK